MDPFVFVRVVRIVRGSAPLRGTRQHSVAIRGILADLSSVWDDVNSIDIDHGSLAIAASQGENRNTESSFMKQPPSPGVPASPGAMEAGAAVLCAFSAWSRGFCGALLAMSVILLPAATLCAQGDAVTNAKAAEARAKSDAEQAKKASEWVASLDLSDAAREARVRDVIVTHLKAVRDWHNEHPFTNVPAGINPATGKRLSDLDRQMIADSAMPRTVHENLMSGLRKDLSEEQVEAILDKYTIGKVAFTMSGYRAIVPDLTDEEARTILGFLKEAREEAVDFKNMNQISAIFEIHKTRSEQYLNSNGRNWRQLYKAYTDAARARKAAGQAAAPAK